MKIIVLVKESIYEHVDYGFKINPYDLFSFKKALSLKNSGLAEIICVSMGPESTKSMLRKCLALGADTVYHLHDQAFSGADTYATSYVLSKAIEKLSPFDFVFCGAQSTEGETSHIGPAVASWLNIPFYTNITDMYYDNMQNIVFEKSDNDSILCFTTTSKVVPALICCKYFDNEYITPSLFSIKKSENTIINEWGIDSQNIDKTKCGFEGSKTRVLKSQNIKTKKSIANLNEYDHDTFSYLIKIIKEHC